MGVIFTDGIYKEEAAPHIFAPEVTVKGVFDTMLVLNGTVQDARAHFERLIRDVDSVLGYPQSVLPNFAELSQIWGALLESNGLEKDYARLRTLIIQGDNPSVIISAEPTQNPDGLPPIKCAIIRDFPRHAGSKFENAKNTDYTRAFAAREAAKRKGADEAILTNSKGTIACGAVANIFIEENGVLITPPLSDGVMAGITRAKLIADKGACEESINEPRLRSADAVYLTNSLIGMRTVIKIIT